MLNTLYALLATVKNEVDLLQGIILSPILYSLYINDPVTLLEKEALVINNGFPYPLEIEKFTKRFSVCAN